MTTRIDATCAWDDTPIPTMAENAGPPLHVTTDRAAVVKYGVGPRAARAILNFVIKYGYVPRGPSALLNGAS